MSCVVGCGGGAGGGGGGGLGPGGGLELRGVRGGRPPARTRQGPARQHRARRTSLVTIFRVWRIILVKISYQRIYTFNKKKAL